MGEQAAPYNGIDDAMIRRANYRQELYDTIHDFADTELYAVLFVARRLQKGRRQYGVLNPLDGRDWLREAAEERADMLVYEAAEEMKRQGIGA